MGLTLPSTRRGDPLDGVVLSLVIVWLGVQLAHG
jgi:hypothetical protein